MRKSASLLVILLLCLGSVCLADQPAPPKQAPAAAAKAKTHDVTTQVVAVNAEAKTITIKSDKGEDVTVPVMERAVEMLSTLKKGDRIVATCTDNPDGSHKGVTNIKPAA